MKPKRLNHATLAATILLTACDSQRLNEFSNFAAAGTTYISALHFVVEQAGSAMVAADSAALATARAQAGTDFAKHTEEYGKDVHLNDQLIANYLGELNLVDAHASLLGAYFDKVSQLSEGKAAGSIATSAAGLVDSIAAFNPKIETAQFAGKSVQDYVKSATALIVAHFEVKALDERLKTDAPVIDKALYFAGRGDRLHRGRFEVESAGEPRSTRNDRCHRTLHQPSAAARELECKPRGISSLTSNH